MILSRVLQWLLLLALLAAALPLLLMGLIRSPAVRDTAKREVGAVIERELGLRARFSDLDVAPFAFALVARSISLEHPKEGRLLDAGELRIRPSLRALLLGKLDLNVVEVERATVFLRLRDGALVNLPTFPEGNSEDTGELELPFNRFNLSRARVLLDGEDVASGELSGVEIEVDARETGRISVRLEIGHGALHHSRGDEALSTLQVRGELRGQRVHLEQARVEMPDLSVLVHDAALQLPVVSLETAHFDGSVELRAYLPALARVPWLDEVPKLAGEVRAKGRIKGEGEAVYASGSVDARQVYIDQFGLGERATVGVELSPEEVRFDGTLQEIDRGGQLAVAGALSFTDGYPLTVKARAQKVGFGKLMKQLGVSDDPIVDWQLTGGFEMAGTTSPLHLRGPLRFHSTDFSITKEPFHHRERHNILHIDRADLVGALRVTDAGISLIDIDATLPHSHLEVAEVLLGFDNSLRVRAQGAAVDLRDVTPLVDFELDGQGSFDVLVTGHYTTPVVSGSLNFKRFSFATFPFGNVQSKFKLERELQAVRFADVLIDKSDSRYSTSSLLIDFSDNRILVESRLDLERMWIADFYHIFHFDQDERFDDYQGLTEGTADLRYTIGFPGDSAAGTLRAGLDLKLPQMSLDGYAFSDGEFQGHWLWLDHREGYEGGELSIERFSMRKGKGTASISGAMHRGGRLDLVVLGDRMSVADTEGLGDRLVGLTGTYSIIGAVKGVLDKPRANLDVIGAGLRYRGEPLGVTRAYVRLTDQGDPWISAAKAWPKTGELQGIQCGYGRRGLWHADWPPDPPTRTADGWREGMTDPMAWVLCGSALGGEVDLDLAFARAEQLPVRGRVTFKRLNFGKFLPKSRAGKALVGSATGCLDLNFGVMQDFGTLAGALHLSELTAGRSDVQLNNDGPIDVRFGEGSLHVARASLLGPNSKLSVRGGGSVDDGLSLRAEGDLDLSLLTHMSTRVTDAKGRLRLEFRVVGGVDEPRLFGSASVQDAAMRVNGFSSPIAGVSGEVKFSEQRIVLEGIEANVLGGVVKASGSAAMSGRGLGSYRLQIEGAGMSLRPKEDVSMRFGGRTQLAWTKGESLPKLTGTLRLDEARYGRDIQVGRSIQDLYRKQRASVDDYDPAGDMVTLDLQVAQTQPIRIENNIIDADVVLDTRKRAFRLVGTNQRFGVLGSMSVKRGTLSFRDTTFVIRDGGFHFENPARIDPRFDMRAVTDVKRAGALSQNIWHIGMHAWGTSDDFRWDLSSDPHLSEDDIALLLTLGMTHAELAQLNAGDLTGTAALEALATVTGVEREVQRALPTIDDFRVQSAYSQRSNRTEPQLYVGKRLADRVRLSASTGVGASRDFRAGVELQVSDQTSIQPSYSNQNASGTSLGDIGVDLRWRLEFD